MKKVACMFLSLLALAGCKQNNEKIQSGTEPETAVTDTSDCERTIVIDPDKIAPNEWAAWDAENRKYYCTPNPCEQKKCESNKKYVDLALIKAGGTSNEEADFNIQSEWLRKNRLYICYEESYPYIQKAHEITHGGKYQELLSVPDSAIEFVKLSELKKEIAGQGGDYVTDKYNNYVFFSDSAGKLMTTVKDEYNYKYIGYSIPFLRSIIYCNTFENGNTDPKLGIFKFPTDPALALVTYFIKVEVMDPNDSTKKIIRFYDYSTKPDKGTDGSGAMGKTKETMSQPAK